MRKVFFLLLAWCVSAPLPALAQSAAQAEAMLKASEAAAKWQASRDAWLSAVDKYNAAYTRLTDLTTRYNAVKAGMKDNEKKLVEDGLSLLDKTQGNEYTLLRQQRINPPQPDGEIMKKLKSSQADIDAATTLYNNGMYAKAAAKYAGAIATANAAANMSAKSKNTLQNVLSVADIVEVWIKSYENP